MYVCNKDGLFDITVNFIGTCIDKYKFYIHLNIEKYMIMCGFMVLNRW